jgi:hypothetical protein
MKNWRNIIAPRRVPMDRIVRESGVFAAQPASTGRPPDRA